MARRPIRTLFHRKKEHRCGLLQAPREEMARSNSKQCRVSTPRVKPRRGFEVLDGELMLSIPQSQPATARPTNGRAWIELQRAIDEVNGSIEISLEVTKNVGHITQNTWVVYRRSYF